MTEGACNYDPTATLPGTFDFDSCAGCTDPNAYNYDENATIAFGPGLTERQYAGLYAPFSMHATTTPPPP